MAHPQLEPPLLIITKQQKKQAKKYFGIDLAIMTQLWQLGVMPYSKHTNNLDYEKYV